MKTNTNTVDKGNILIARFIGFKVEDDYVHDFKIGEDMIAMHRHIKTMLFHKSWDWLMPVIKKIDSLTNEEMTFAEYDDYRNSQWKMIDNPSKYSIDYVHKQVVEFILKNTKTKNTEEEDDFEDLKEIHEKIRNILINSGAKEFGDCVIDEISQAVGLKPTTIYYDED